MMYLLVLLVFYFLHLDFFVRYYFFGQTEHEFLVGTQVYNYDETIAAKTCGFACLCFVTLIAGLLTRHKRVRVWEDVDEAMLRRIFQWSLIACIGINVIFTVLSQTLGYGEFTEAVAENSFWWQLKAIPLVACCLMFGIQVRFSTLDKSLLAVFLLLSLLTLTRSTFLEVIAIVGIYCISRNDNRIKKWYFGVIVLLLATVNTVATFRETRDLSGSLLGEDGRKIMLKNEYLVFLDGLLSETMGQVEGNYLCGETFVDVFKLLVPSIIRKWVGISDNAHPIFGEIGWAAFPDYGGGFSFLAECYLNFGWLGAGCMFVFGALLKRFYTLMDFTRRKGLLSMYSVCPLVVLDLHLMYRNGSAAHIKYFIQVCVLAIVIMYLCSRKTKVVSLDSDGPAN